MIIHAFEEQFDTMCDGTSKCLRMKQTARNVAASVVSVTSYLEASALFTCSGTIISWDGLFGCILTSATLLNYRSDKGYIDNLKVIVKLSNAQHSGLVLWHDLHLNIAVIMFKSIVPLQVAKFDTGACPCPDDEVLALGRHYENSSLMAAHGEVNLKCSKLDCEELLTSNCKITKPGIGGPLINPKNGCVVGMNFYDMYNTPFLPSSMVVRSLNHFETYGRVIQPWLGLKFVGLYSLNLYKMEKINQKFHNDHGLLVKKVLKPSPARVAGIQRGDIITHCDGMLVHSVLELSAMLLDLSAKFMSKNAGCLKMKKMEVKVVLRRMSEDATMTKTLLVNEILPKQYNRWPVLAEK